MEIYENYLGSVGRRLLGDGFQVENEIDIDGFEIDLFAFKHALLRGTNYDCYIVEMGHSSLEAIQDFSKAAFSHAKSYKASPLDTYMIFPVLCSRTFDDDSKKYVRTFNGAHYPSPNIEHPVLVELGSKSIIQYERKPFYFGRLAVRGAIKFANEHFSIP
jgi:hypothetical protein